MRTKIQDSFIKYLECVSERRFLLYWFTTIINYPEVNETFNKEKLTMEVPFSRFNMITKGEVYQLVEDDKKHLYVVENYEKKEDVELLTLEYLGSNLETPLIKINNDFDLYPNEIMNFKGDKPIITTPGFILLNQRIFVESFGDIVPYINKEIKVGDLDDILADLLFNDKVTMEQAHQYMTNCYDIGYFTELCNRNFTDKSFTTHPDMVNRKKELFSKLSEEDKKNPLILSKIEDELLALDKEYIKGDDADVFHAAQGGKSYDVHRKKLFITVGAIPSFSDKGEAEFNLIENSLSEGWDKYSFDTRVNEIYKGSYDRGAETAKGGELTKYVLRVFQDLAVSEDDCGSTLGVTVELTDNATDKANLQFVGRTNLENNLPFSKEEILSNLGKTIKMRDPLFCKSKSGICYKCMGYNFERIKEIDIGSYILDVSSGIMMISMKNMHGTKLSTKNINFKDYLITL